MPHVKLKATSYMIHNDGLLLVSADWLLLPEFCFLSFFLSFTHKQVRITDVLFFYSYDHFRRSFLSVFSVASYLYRQDVPAADYIIPGGRGV